MPLALILRARTTALAILGTLEMGWTVKVGLVSFTPFNLSGQVFNRLGLNRYWSCGDYQRFCRFVVSISSKFRLSDLLSCVFQLYYILWRNIFVHHLQHAEVGWFALQHVTLRFFFELNINLLQNKVFSLELVPVVKMATRTNFFFFPRIQSCAYMYPVSVQLHTKFEQGWNFCHFPGYLIPMEATYLKYNVISQITFLTLIDWKYPSKAQVYLL